LPYNHLYHRLGSQDSNTDASQIINETKAAQAKLLRWLSMGWTTDSVWV